MSDSVGPHRRQPTRLPYPWDSPGKNTGMGCHFLLQCMKVKSESEVAQSCLTLLTPWAAAHQAPPSMGFSRQEYWSRVPLPSPEHLLHTSYFLNPWQALCVLIVIPKIDTVKLQCYKWERLAIQTYATYISCWRLESVSVLPKIMLFVFTIYDWNVSTVNLSELT